jgi:predicted RNA-binding Zn ribbon-like protein
MKPLFLGSHPALDFLNTRPSRQGEPVELIGDGRSFAAWLETAGLLESAAKLERRLGTAPLEAAAAEARKLREWARDWLPRWREAPRRDHAAELRRLNALLGQGTVRRELVASKAGMQLREQPRLESAEDLIALLAAQLALLVAAEAPELVKRCGGTGCTLWFVDRTKAHGRLFCSAAACGNRAKVAAFRERQRRARRRPRSTAAAG